MQENLILAYYAQIWKFGLRLPKMEFFKKNSFFEKVSRFRFQRALNHPQTLRLSKVMQENVILVIILCPNMEIRPQAPKNGIFQKKFIFLKRSSNFASNDPQPPAVMQENISKKLSVGLNFSTPSGGVTSPSLKGPMVWA